MSNQIFPELSKAALEIAGAYAIVFPERPSQRLIIGMINEARTANRVRGLMSDEADDAIAKLVAAGLLMPSVECRGTIPGHGPGAVVGTITYFCEIALNEGLASIVVEGMMQTYQWANYRREQFTGQRLRFDLMSGQLKNLMGYDVEDSELCWLFEARAAQYLRKLPDPLRQRACEACLNFGIDTFQPINAFLKTCEAYAPEFHMLLESIARAHILSGEFDKACEVFTRLPTTQRSRKPVVVAALATDALIATLQGNDATAFEKIKACLEAELSGTRKRKVYPDFTTFSLALLSLFRSTSPEGDALLLSLRSMHKKSRQAARFESLFNAAEHARLPSSGHGQLDINGRDIDTLLLAIAGRWHTDYQPEPNRECCPVLLSLLLAANAAGYHWVVAEVLTVLEASGHAEGVDAIVQKPDAVARHRRLGTKSLTQLVRSLEVWEFSLQTLESLVPASAVGNRVSTTSAIKQARLTWRIEVHGECDQLVVVPQQQRIDKSGKWSSRRAVSLKRLHDKASKMEHLIEQDRNAAAAIETRGFGWGPVSSSGEYTLGAKSVYCLVGHPYVFNERGETVEVVERPASLQISTSNDHLKVSFVPLREGYSSYQISLNSSRTKLEVTHYTAAQTRISNIISAAGSAGLYVPIVAKQRLLHIAFALADNITVQSDVKDSATEQHQGDPHPLLQLDYSGDTLSIRIRVEPLADSGQFFDAGEGGEVVYVNAESGWQQVVRDTGRERALVHLLIESSQCLSKVFDGRMVMQIDKTEQALELLDELQQLSIRCIWPRDTPLTITARADSSQLSLTIKSAAQWFTATGELKYTEDDSLSLTRLLQLIGNSSQSRFIELASGEFLALSKTLQQQLKALQTYGGAQSARSGEQRLHSLSMLALEPLLQSAEIHADKHWLEWRSRFQKAGSVAPALPATLQADLRPYQLEGYQWLAQMAELGAGACLADDMGLGKTLQSIAILLHRAPDGPAMVVAPTSVTGNWLQEVQRFAPTLNVKLYGGSADSRKQVLANLQPFDLLIVSYGLLHSGIESINQIAWRTVVLDEAQVIKNASTRRARAARSLNADFRIATTGTPIQNNLMDLHSLFGFLIPGLLGSGAKFRNTFALPIERNNDGTARQQLHALVSPFILRRNKRDVLKDLPARTDITLSVELSGEEAALYEALRQQALEAATQSAKDSGSGKKKLQVLAELTRLRRLCCNPQLIQADWSGPMAKLTLFASTIEELLSNQHKVLVFSQFVDHLKILERHLIEENIAYQYLDGSTTAKQRTQRVADFQSGLGDVFLISLTAGGTGLNLTAADYVIHMDPWWNPAVEDQASDRAHRIGQQRPVTIYRLVAASTIEVQIQKLHATKRDLADSLLSDTDSARFDMEEILDMLRTSAIDVVE